MSAQGPSGALGLLHRVQSQCPNPILDRRHSLSPWLPDPAPTTAPLAPGYGPAMPTPHRGRAVQLDQFLPASRPSTGQRSVIQRLSENSPIR